MKKSCYTKKAQVTKETRGASLSLKQEYHNKLSCRMMIHGHHHRRWKSCELARFNSQPVVIPAAAADDEHKQLIMRAKFGEDEEDLIIRLHALLGNNRWSLIAGRLPGRREDEVKNHWDAHLKQKLINNGIDPDNHRLNQTINHRTQSICNSSTSQNNQQHHSHN